MLEATTPGTDFQRPGVATGFYGYGFQIWLFPGPGRQFALLGIHGQAEVTAAKTMIERTHDNFDLWPERLIADTGYGSAGMLNWLVHERGIEPHIPVFDKSQRKDGTFPRDDFIYDHASDTYR